MGVPQVVIIGRPNVGKSSLLNWLAGVRVAIIDAKPGITRDRVTYLMCHEDRFFELVDTGHGLLLLGTREPFCVVNNLISQTLSV